MNYPAVNINTAGEELNRLHAEIEGKMRSTVQDAIRAGEILSQVKEKISHGTFLAWIAANCAFNERTAQRYMGVFEHRSKTDSVSDLQEAYRQVETLEAQARRTEDEQARDRVAAFLKTGKKPEGWRRGTDDDLAKKEKARIESLKKWNEEMKAKNEERLRDSEERASRINSDLGDILKMAHESASQIAARQTFKEKIRISHEGKDDPFLDALIDYLDTLDDDTRRIEACANIIKICRGISIDLQKGGAA